MALLVRSLRSVSKKADRVVYTVSRASNGNQSEHPHVTLFCKVSNYLQSHKINTVVDCSAGNADVTGMGQSSAGLGTHSSHACYNSMHSTAIVHKDAVISEDVVIGPFCTVGSQVKLGKGCILHPNCHVKGRTELGEGCTLHTGAVVGANIPGSTIIGQNNSIGHYAVVGIKCQDLKYKDGEECFLQIGNDNDIREYVSIHLSSKCTDKTIIGDGNLIMGSCHIAHDCKLGDHNILANGTLLGGHVILQDHVHTGGGVAVHQRCQIDSYAFVSGGTMVVQDVPMYVMVSGARAEICGLNLEGLRRHGFSHNEIQSIRKVYRTVFMNTHSAAGTLEERLSKLEACQDMMDVPAVVEMLNSIRNCLGAGRRGICKFGRWNHT